MMSAPTLPGSFQPFGKGHTGTPGTLCRHAKPEGKELTMSEQNKALSKRNFEEVWNQRKLNVIDELVSANTVLNDPSTPGATVPGAAVYRQFAQMYPPAPPAALFPIPDQFADGDKVATRWTASGTHKAGLMG